MGWYRIRAKLELISLVALAALVAGLFLIAVDLLPVSEARGGRPIDIWPPSYTQIGHKTDTPRTFAPSHACTDLDAVIHIIELSRVSDAAVQEFWDQMMVGGACKLFPNGLSFWPDLVVVEMNWADGDLMWIVKGHDRTYEHPLYTWVPAVLGRALSIPPPG